MVEMRKFGDFATFKYGKMPNKKKITETGKYPVYSGYRYVGYYDEYNTEANQIIVVARGVGGTGDVKLTKEQCYLTNLSISADINENIALPEFIYYYYSLSNLRYLDSGSAQSQITISDLEKVMVPLPSLDEQRAICSYLKMLDRKIEINEEINDNLLQQVTACFHHYFDAYETSTDAIGFLGDVAQFKYGTMPKKDKLGSGEYVAFSGYQVVGSYPEKMFSNPQLIVVARGVGGCGDIKYTPSNCYLTNLSIAILSQNTTIEDYLFNYLRLHDTKVMNTGSAQPQITVSTLEKYQLPIPPEDLLTSFSTFVQPFKTLYRKNKAEIERLQVLRDTLLPRLMSGELDVSNIDI